MKLRRRVGAALRAQFGRPRGLWGHAVGFVLAHRSSNRGRNQWVVSLLGVRPDDRVLEIGFGPGLAILELSRLAPEGHVCGIDHSELMVPKASKRNADGIRRGVVDLRLGSVDALPAFDAPFDEVLAVNATAKGRELAAALARAGFSEVRVETMALKPAVVCALGTNAADAPPS